MILKVDWEEPIIQENDVLQIQPSDLNDFYVAASDFDKSNIFFVLLTSFHYYHACKSSEKAAHLSFLIAYYLFITLTPPGSWELAMYYIDQAISLNPLETYKEWHTLIEQGN